MSAFIVTCVHGTWARNPTWAQLEQSVSEALARAGSVEFRSFRWSGRNSVDARIRGASALRRHLREEISACPDARHVLVAHSHGASVVLHALDGAEPAVTGRVAGIALLSPPLLDCAMIDDAAAAANRLLLGAMTAIPVLPFAVLSVARALGLPWIGALLGGVAALVLWLALFRPARIRRRAERLAGELALPRLAFPGLIVRAPGDEAAAALASVGAFARLARVVWSWILRVRTPFHRDVERRLRAPDAHADGLTGATVGALALVPATFAWLSFGRQALDTANWAVLAVAIPMTVTAGIAALVLVGGSVLLVLLLPALSVLLWPFGIFPTAAAALLTVSVQEAPTPDWMVVQVPGTHRTHGDPTALDAVADYVRTTAAPELFRLYA